MYHFSEGAIDDDSVSSQKSIHVLSKSIEGGELSIILIAETTDQTPENLVAERLRQAEISLSGFRNKLGKRAQMGGAEAVSFGWEYNDDEQGYLAAHQIIAVQGERVVSLSATFPIGIRDQGIAAMTAVAAAVRWRAS